MTGDDRQKIENCKENYRRGMKFTPVIALRSGKVLDGAHRVIAARELQMPIEVVYLDAIAIQENPYFLDTWLGHTEEVKDEY